MTTQAGKEDIGKTEVRSTKKNATFMKAKGRAEIGATRRGKGMKIMAIGRHGLSISVSTHAAPQHEVRVVPLCFDFYMISWAETASR